MSSCRLRSTHTDQDGFVTDRLALDQLPCFLELWLIVPYQISNEDIGFEAEHERDSSATGTDFRPFLCSRPASSDTRLLFTRMMTTPSGINVNVILSPAFMRRPSRIAFGIVV